MEDMKVDRSLVTNQQVADDLGVTHSAISRIRSNDRKPSMTLMVKITQTYGWGPEAQALAFFGTGDEKYGNQFERVLRDHYGR